jgi:tRNA 2-thiouridine synthesizing protein E
MNGTMKNTMQLVAGDRAYSLDGFGFLRDSPKWDTLFAEEMARRLGMPTPLGVVHWKVVLFVRNWFLKRGAVARVHETCRGCRLSLKQLHRLFPAGYLRGACRLAGIPYTFISAEHYALTYDVASSLAQDYHVSSLGCLVDPWEWDPGFAQLAAAQAGIPTLTPGHWEIIKLIRATFLTTGSAPSAVEACRHAGLTIQELGELFPGGYHQDALRLAGLPSTAR